MRRLLALAVLVFALAPAAPAGSISPTAGLQSALDRIVGGNGTGAILFLRDGDRTLRLSSGLGQLRPRTPLHADDRFRVGSVTKSFVAAAVLQLVGEGKVSLKDPVERWLPGLLPNGREVTVRHLLNHTSGIYNYTDDPRIAAPFLAGDFGHVWTPRELIAVATSHDPLFAPGSSWSYSNTNYIVLGLIVEAATGHPLADELRARVFDRLGLDATLFPADATIPGRHAHGYSTVRGPDRDVTAINPSWAWAAGGIVSNAPDLADFYRALLRGDLVTPHLVWRMESTVEVTGAGAYGLGLVKTQLPCSIVWGHDGHIPGYLTFAFSSGNGRRQVVLAVNDDTLSRAGQEALGQTVVSAYCGPALRA
jgi:D-alanyl-D-alanine carboxypeptidase